MVTADAGGSRRVTYRTPPALLGPHSSGANGTVLTVDGGTTAVDREHRPVRGGRTDYFAGLSK